MTRILVVEDDPDLAFGLKNNLEIEGYEVEVVADGEAAVARATAWMPTLMILDLMLPGLDGLRVLRAVRAQNAVVRILILTARGDETDKVRGLKLGADDYVTKPFGLLELLARVESLLRRYEQDAAASADSAATAGSQEPSGQHAGARLRFGDVEVDVRGRRVFKAGRPVALRPKEIDLLLELLRQRGAVVSRLELMRAVWGYSSAVITRTVDTHIGELRRKLETDPARPRHIVTVRNIGYRLDD
jgi:two-component system alkaline phosphatase synthesis response regulator PhoP